ncbi:Dps family protein [Catalinimonas niigatensis]|uniref:Dps family protein n=1 Tax=Catalinimonas niigatensis TaxID=1397264 RepID=UPI0026661313|nr:DNA starvation/stationary phase protection protein [Catalinimonas niigatensis]WPP48738.1 DNA starvation/stationary phase protection protein [Catalinimonas niigatensis]
MEAKIGIQATHLDEVALILCNILADEFLLYTKTRNAHWNIEGPDFYSKHKFFESQYKQLDEFIDKVAERIRTLGHYAPATLREYLKLTHFSEHMRAENNSLDFIKELLSDHESLIIQLRGHINTMNEVFKDLGTGDFITGLLEMHEKMAWMLRAHLK